MKLFKLPPPPIGLQCEPTEEALAQREALLESALTFTVVKDADENQHVAVVGQAIRKHLNEVERDRKEITAPYLEAQRVLKSMSDNYIQPLTRELRRLEDLSVGYVSEQERKAEAERKARAEEIARLQAAEAAQRQAAIEAQKKGDLSASLVAEMSADAALVTGQQIISTPPPERDRAAGQAFTQKVLGWECTDPIALWNARPDLCNPPEPKASAIRASCSPDRPINGLRLWWESKVTFKSR